eukprot:3933583-Rhodomonas_salina.1
MPSAAYTGNCFRIRTIEFTAVSNMQILACLTGTAPRRKKKTKKETDTKMPTDRDVSSHARAVLHPERAEGSRRGKDTARPRLQAR